MQITYFRLLHLKNTPGCILGGKWQSLHYKAKLISIYMITLATAQKSLLFPNPSYVSKIICESVLYTKHQALLWMCFLLVLLLYVLDKIYRDYASLSR